MATLAAFGITCNLFFLLAENIENTHNTLQSQSLTVVFLSTQSENTQANQIKAVKAALVSEQNISLRLITPGEFLERLRTQNPKQADLFDHPELKEHLPTFLEIKGVLTQWGLQKLRSLAEIDSIETSQTTNEPYFLALQTAYLILRLTIFCMAAAGVVLVLSISRMSIQLLKTHQKSFFLWGGSHLLVFIPVSVRLAVLLAGSLTSTVLFISLWRHGVIPLFQIMEWPTGGLGADHLHVKLQIPSVALLTTGLWLTGVLLGLLGNLSLRHIEQPEKLKRTNSNTTPGKYDKYRTQTSLP